jgi:phospholipase C
MRTRRDFFKRAAALTGSAGLATTLLSSIQRASAIEPALGSTFLDAEHVVILMQENRSFDHCFGRLRGVRGFNDPRAVTLPDGKPVWLQTNKEGETYAPFRLDLKGTRATWLGSLPHSWSDQTDARNHGNHDSWLDSKFSSRRECAGMPLTMGYYDREDIPFYYAFADAFTICDQHFCSSLTGTTPNRLYLWTGTVREKQEAAATPNVRNSEVDENSMAQWKTFPERIEEAGVSWKIYQNEIDLMTGFTNEEKAWLSNYSDNPIEWFTQYHAGFSKTYRRHLDNLVATLPGEIEQLRQSAAAASGPAAAKAKRDLAAAEALRVKATAERPRWTDEAYAKLSPHQRNLHNRAFTTNSGDPFYRQLTTLRYREGGDERELAIPKGDVFHQFRQDVRAGELPTVSWLVAPANFSDHPSSPWYGAWYVAEALDILTKNPEVWKKTILILTYDENDGYFDHVPPFVAPNPGDPASGKTSLGIDSGLDYLVLEQDLARQAGTRQAANEARGGPVGLGYRVPLLVASPWSRGGYVCSQVFDHTSVLQLLEKVLSHRSGKQIEETNISAWRRSVCGDMTSVFRPFQDEHGASLAFPSKDSFLEDVHKARFKALPAGYKKLSAADIETFKRDRVGADWMPRQEPGVRPSCALPYELYAEGSVGANGRLFEIALEARNEIFGKASAGSAFHVYTPGRYHGEITGRTRAYAVAAGQRVSDSWEVDGFENGVYHLRVCGPNGFFREFAGSRGDPPVVIHCDYVRVPHRNSALTGDILIQASGGSSGKNYHFGITDHAYKSGNRIMEMRGGGKQSMVIHLSRSLAWYDFSVTIAGADAFLRRYAGRVETGQAGFSDPAMA